MSKQFTLLGSSQHTLDSIRDIRLYQSKAGYRFSVDALLLFSFVTLPRLDTIIDLGAGSGIIGLLLAKRYRSATITLVEVQKSLCELSRKNAQLNELDERVSVIMTDIKELASNDTLRGFDLAVSNPPFRRLATGKLSIGDERAIARHEINLRLSDLAAAASSVLRHRGRFFMIHLPERLPAIVAELSQQDLQIKRLRFVHSHGKSKAKMVLLEAVKGGRSGVAVEEPLFIYQGDGDEYTEEMREIYGN